MKAGQVPDRHDNDHAFCVPVGGSLAPGSSQHLLQDIEPDVAAADDADYQRLTAEGKLGEAGRRLEELKQKLDRLNAAQK
jgi:hypothetical protein